MAEHTNTTESDDHGAEATGRPRYDDINTPVVVLVGALSAIVTIAIIAAVQGLCYQWERSELTNKTVTSWKATDQVEEQKKMLNGGDGLVSIEDAMNKVVSSYGNQ